MLYVSGTHERDGREEALCVTYLLAVTGHVVSEHQNPCQVNFLAVVGAQGLQNDDRQRGIPRVDNWYSAIYMWESHSPGKREAPRMTGEKIATRTPSWWLEKQKNKPRPASEQCPTERSPALLESFHVLLPWVCRCFQDHFVPCLFHWRSTSWNYLGGERSDCSIIILSSCLTTNKNQARRSGTTKKTITTMPSVLIHMLTVWYVLFWLNVLRSECLDSLTTLWMLYGQRFDVDEDKHTFLFSQTGLKFHQSWVFGPPFIDHIAANYLGG